MNSGTHTPGEGSFNGVDSMRAVLSVWTHVTMVPVLGPRPDTRWIFTDSAGHKHAYNVQDEDDRYPTLMRYTPEHQHFLEVSSGDDEYYCTVCDSVVWQCRICNEVIEPGLRDSTSSVRRDGPREWSAVLDFPSLDALPEVGAMGVVWFRRSPESPAYFGVAVCSEVYWDDISGSRAVFTGAGALGRAAP